MHSGVGPNVQMNLVVLCLSMAVGSFIGTYAAIPSESRYARKPRACAVYLLQQRGYPHRSVPYLTSSRTLHLSTLTPPALWLRREFSLHIQLKDFRPIVVYVNDNILSVRFGNDDLLASERLHHPSLSHAAAVSDSEAVVGLDRRKRATPTDSRLRHHPIGGRAVTSDAASLSPNSLAPPEYAASPGYISGPGHSRDDTVLRDGESDVWWSMTVQFTDQLILVKRPGSSSAIAVGHLPQGFSSDNFTAEAFVSSKNAIAFTFDCVSGCPVFPAALEGVSFPILQPGPPLVLFLYLDEDSKQYTLDIVSGLCPSNSSTTTTNPEQPWSPSFSFALSTNRAGRSPPSHCVNITFKTPRFWPPFNALPENASTNETTSDRQKVSFHFILILEQTTKDGKTQVSITQGSGPSRHSVTVNLEGEVTTNKEAYFTPLTQHGVRFSLNCFSSDSPMDSPVPHPRRRKECSGAGLAWSLTTLALLVVALLIAAIVVFIRPTCRYRWEELDYESEEERSHFVVPIPEDEVSQLSYRCSGSNRRPTEEGEEGIKDGGHKSSVTPVLIFSTLREAEEVSEPGSPLAPEQQSSSSGDGPECVSGLTVDTTLGKDTPQHC